MSRCVGSVSVVALWFVSWQVLGDDPFPSRVKVAATVNGSAISVHEVELELARVFKGRDMDEAAAPHFRAQALQQLIDRQLILQWLFKRGQAATTEEVDLEVARLKKRLAQTEQKLEDFLAPRMMNRADLARALQWQLSWDRFLQAYVTAENLERYFQDHRANFDGTRLRVAHIFLAVDSDSPNLPAMRQERIAEATQIRDRILAGEMTFVEAARAHSDAPTADVGGEIGLISRHAPMPESFSAAAYRLPLHSVSDPVVTTLGVHLIRCQEILVGQKRWQDVRDELEPAMARFLFQWAADRDRNQANIEFTGEVEHFLPGTRMLAQ